jgi:hypothetical protein
MNRKDLVRFRCRTRLFSIDIRERSICCQNWTSAKGKEKNTLDEVKEVEVIDKEPLLGAEAEHSVLKTVQDCHRDTQIVHSEAERKFYFERKLPAVLHEFCVLDMLGRVGFVDDWLEQCDGDVGCIEHERRFYGDRSQACIACGDDLGCTIRITTACNRQCFFCFTSRTRDMNVLSLEEVNEEIEKCRSEKTIKAVAISGGEPLLFHDAVCAAFHLARQRLGNEVHMRLYTNGDLLSEKRIDDLVDAGVDEIRISVKPGERPRIELLEVAVKRFRAVWVELPALPGETSSLVELAIYLDGLGIKGMNVIEGYYNGYDSDEFCRRGLKLAPISRVRPAHSSMPAFEYPIAGSRKVTLDVVEAARRHGLRLSVHACLHETRAAMFSAKDRRLAMKNLSQWQKVDARGLIRTCVVFLDDFDKHFFVGQGPWSGELHYAGSCYRYLHVDACVNVPSHCTVFGLLIAPDGQSVSDIWVERAGTRILHSKTLRAANADGIESVVACLDAYSRMRIRK